MNKFTTAQLDAVAKAVKDNCIYGVDVSLSIKGVLRQLNPPPYVPVTGEVYALVRNDDGSTYAYRRWEEDDRAVGISQKHTRRPLTLEEAHRSEQP